MRDVMLHFVDACTAVNDTAGARDYPPFTTGLREETPLNSAPYLFDPEGFRNAFATSEHRRTILAGCEQALNALARYGVRWHMLLIGGSFIRAGATPGDLDGLLVYSIDPQAPTGIEAALARFVADVQRHSIDLMLCPADVDPILLVKRVIFFSNLFSYDREADQMVHGTVMLVPARDASIERPIA